MKPLPIAATWPISGPGIGWPTDKRDSHVLPRFVLGAAGEAGLSEQEPPGYTNAPETIWALSEGERPQAVMDIFRQASIGFMKAVASNNVKAAQEFATSGIAVIAGLFPLQDDPAHDLIASLIGVIIAARSGSSKPILLQPGARIAGTKGGFGQVFVAAAAVAAVAMLHERGVSKLAARKTAAKILADNGYSLRRGDHGEPIPITWSAIRAWEEKPEDNPIIAASVPAMRERFELLVSDSGLTTLQEVTAWLESKAPDLLAKALAF